MVEIIKSVFCLHVHQLKGFYFHIIRGKICFETILTTRVNTKNLFTNYYCCAKKGGIMVVKMNFLVGTFLISRSKVVCVPLEGVKTVEFKWVVLLVAVNSISSLKLMPFHVPMVVNKYYKVIKFKYF